MSDNPAIDSIVYTGANDFEEPSGEFSVMSYDIVEHTGLKHPIDVLKAIHARAEELGKNVNITLQEKLNDPEVTILWQPQDEPADDER